MDQKYREGQQWSEVKKISNLMQRETCIIVNILFSDFFFFKFMTIHYLETQIKKCPGTYDNCADEKEMQRFFVPTHTQLSWGRQEGDRITEVNRFS